MRCSIVIPLLIAVAMTSCSRRGSAEYVGDRFIETYYIQVDQALALASGPADRVTLLHVVPGFSAGVPPHLYRYGIAEYQDQLLRDARRRLHLALPVKRHSPATIHARVLLGDTTTEISRVVESLGADLLLIGVPKRGIVSRTLFGSTAARLLRLSRVPILAVPEAQSASRHEEAASLTPAA